MNRGVNNKVWVGSPHIWGIVFSGASVKKPSDDHSIKIMQYVFFLYRSFPDFIGGGKRV